MVVDVEHEGRGAVLDVAAFAVVAGSGFSVDGQDMAVVQLDGMIGAPRRAVGNHAHHRAAQRLRDFPASRIHDTHLRRRGVFVMARIGRVFAQRDLAETDRRRAQAAAARRSPMNSDSAFGVFPDTPIDDA